MSRTENVELTTLVMVEDADGYILMQDRLDPDWGGLCFPGGHIEPNESIVQAAIREVQEETGLTVSDLRLCGVKQFPISGGRYLVFFYKTHSFSGTLRDSEEGRVLWLRREELPNYAMCSDLFQMLRLFDEDALSEMRYYQVSDQWKHELR